MQRVYCSSLFRFGGLILGLLIWLANANNPPTGRTGAPFDNGTCNNCHEGGGFTGSVSISGLPAVIAPNTTYPMEITLSPLSGNPNRGGFQLVVVDGNNQNAGDLVAINTQSGTEFFLNREYIEHRAPKLFTGGGPAVWSFNWTSPATAARDTIRFFFIGNFCNGNGSSSGDVAFSGVRTFRFAVDTAVSTNILPDASAVRLYPNPAKDWLYVERADATAVLEVALTDLTGRLLRSATISTGEALWVGDLAPGAYLLCVRAQHDEHWHVQRFVRY